MNEKIIGKCSICGGLVTVPNIWYGINPPIPTCSSCGAVKKDLLPVIDMEPKRQLLNEFTYYTANNNLF